MNIPFALEAYKRERAFTPEQTLVNFIVEKDESNSEPEQERAMLLQRPGLSAYAELPGAVQAIFATNNPAMDLVFAVSQNNLYTVAPGVNNLIGALGGTTDLCSIDANFDRLGIVSYPLFYVYGPTAPAEDAPESNDPPVLTFRNVAIPDGYRAVDVRVLSGYFIVACDDGTFFWLEPGQDEFDPLNFATAESSPDGLVGLTILNGNIVFFGGQVCENWQVTGNANLPFQRTTGQDYARGCLTRDSIVRFDNAIIWVGEDGKVYRADSTPQRISTDGLDERLKLRTGDPSAWTFAHDGHLFYVLTVPGQGTFCYDVASKTWSEFRSSGYAKWRPRVGCFTSSGWLCGDSETGKIWSISDNATDDGVAILRAASATAPVSDKPVRVDNISLDIGCSAACEWRIRWAEADEEIEDQPWIVLNATRKGADVLTYYRMGAARSPWRTFEVQVIDPVIVRLSGARLGEAYR